MEITIHEKKISHFTFHGEKKRADHQSRKYPLPPSIELPEMQQEFSED